MSLDPAPVLDPTVGEWTFDASTLINLVVGDLIGLAAVRFQGRAHILEDVLRLELDRGSTGAIVRRVAWFSEEKLIVQEDLDFYRKVRMRWGTAPDRDRGEAACIVLTRKHGWTMVTDDGVGFQTARDHFLCCTRTPALLISFVRANWLTAAEAWEDSQKMIAAGRRLGILPWRDHQEFDALCQIAGFDWC